MGDLMRPELSLDVAEFNLVLVIFSATVVAIAVLSLVVLYCNVTCGVCRRKEARQRRHSNIPHVMVTQHRDKTPLSIDCPDLDFIDARNTNLVSSTVQVDSVHQTPTLS